MNIYIQYDDSMTYKIDEMHDIHNIFLESISIVYDINNYFQYCNFIPLSIITNRNL